MSKRLMLKLLKLGYYLLQIKTLMERRRRSRSQRKVVGRKEADEAGDAEEEE